MPHGKTAGCGINCAPPTISSHDQLPAIEWTAVPQASSKGSQTESAYSTDPGSDYGHLVDKGFGLAKAVVAGVFSIMGLGCSTEFKPSPEDSWDDGDIAELDSPADEVEFLDTAQDSEDADAMDAEEEPVTIVCEKIGTDTRITNEPSSSNNPSLAWTGSEFGVGFQDFRDSNWEIYFSRISAEGTLIGSDVRLTNATGSSAIPSLAWNGSNFGTCWYDDVSGANEILFRRISPIGELIGSESQISTSGDSRWSSFAWTGSEYGIVWNDFRDGNWEIYFSQASEEGTPLTPNIRATNEPGTSYGVSLAWTGSEYGISWYDERDGNYEIYFRRLSDNGELIEDEVRVTNAIGESYFPSLAWTGSEFGIAWEDSRDGNWEIYFARLSAAGALLASDIRITNDPAESILASLIWSGSEFALSWGDNRFDANSEIFFRRIAGDGSPIDDEIRITGAFGNSERPSLVWTGSEYGISWDDDRDGNAEIYFARVGCHPE